MSVSVDRRTWPLFVMAALIGVCGAIAQYLGWLDSLPGWMLP